MESIQNKVKTTLEDLRPTSEGQSLQTNRELPTEDVCLRILKSHFKEAADKITERDTRGEVKEYKFTDARKVLVTDLLMYFMRHTQSSLNPDKGLLIRGSVGAGKTMLFRIINTISRTRDWVDICGQGRSFKIENSIDIADGYARDGYKYLDRFTRREHATKIADGLLIPINYLFDDLGTDESKKHYGNEINPMARVLDARFNHWLNSNVLTHITTNLTDEELDKYYGTRLHSRFHQMLNQITISDTTDYRQTDLFTK